MIGFVLAAGFGTRMRPLTDHIPKALVPVCGKPLLERALNFIHSNGIDPIGVNAHYLPDQMKIFQTQSPVPFKLFVEEGEIRGTGGAFQFAKQFLSSQDSFFILNVDIISNFDLRSVIQDFYESKSICTLIAFPCDKGKGTVFYDRTTNAYLGTPADFIDSPQKTDASFIGAALYKKEFLDIITPDDFSIVPVWKRAISTGHCVSVNIQKNGFWRDIGNINSLAEMHFDVLDNKIAIDIPSKLSCNTVDKFCIPEYCNSKSTPLSGTYAWIESDKFEGCAIKKSIVWPGMDVKSSTIINSIVTPWGVLPIS